MEMKRYCSYAAMVGIQVAYAGSNILMKMALDEGLNPLVFVVYRHTIAMLLQAPFAFILERKQRPLASFKVMMKIFVATSLGTTIHMNVYYVGLAYTSATVATALSNVVPSLTFIIALLLGMEKLRIRNGRGQAKVLGTVVCVAGSLTFTFWKGGYLFKPLLDRPLIHYISSSSSTSNTGQNWVKGSALFLTSYVAWSFWLILQGVLYSLYPARLSLNVLICFFAALQSSFLALFIGRDPKLWRLDWNVQLLTIVYCGVVISGLVSCLQTWCISENGPVFAAMFSPLLLVTVGIFSAIAFAERIHLGSLLGAIIIIVGLYCIIWGKMKDNVVQEPSIDNTRGFDVKNDAKLPRTTNIDQDF